MTRVLEQLNEDHGNVARLLDVMDAQQRCLARGESFNAPLLTCIMRYLTQYQDVFHHPREDLVFARVIERAPGAARQVRELEAEHRTLGEMGARLYSAAVASRRDAPDEALTPLLAEYAETLREHMHTESRSVFPLAMVILSHADWEHIDTRLEVACDPLFGPRVAHAYRDVFEHIARQRVPTG